MFKMPFSAPYAILSYSYPVRYCFPHILDEEPKAQMDQTP